MYIVCYTGACVHERHQIITINRIHFTLVIALFSLIYVQYGSITGELFFFFFSFSFFSYKIRYGKRPFPLEWCFPSSRQLPPRLGFDGCVKLKSDCLSLCFPLSSDLNFIFLPLVPAASTGSRPRPRGPGRPSGRGRWFTQAAHLHFEATAANTTQQNASTSQACELDVFMPCDAFFFLFLRFFCRARS